MNDSAMSDLGYFGNIWVRQNFLQKAGDTNGGGHQHAFDHVSLLVSGRVRVEVEGVEPKEFSAPTFIVVRKDKNHKFIALEDNVCWYCVFALRDHNGEPIDELFDPARHDPLSSSLVPNGYWEKANSLEQRTVKAVE